MTDGDDAGRVLAGDELAGVVDLFGALDREELHWAVSELLYRRGDDPDEQPIEMTIETAVDAYELVYAGGAVEPEPDETPLIAGPAAFPTTPEHAEDLPHILDIEPRRVDRDVAGDVVHQRYVAAVQTAIETGDKEQATQLLDLGYDIESWAPVDVAETRNRLDELLDST